jgi:anti-sigma B factor antagonist
MPAFSSSSDYLSVKDVEGVAVILILETATMLDGDRVEKVARELFELIETKKYKKVLLNLYNAGYMSSTMLAQLVRLQRKMHEQRGKLRLCCLRPPVMDAFKVSQFDHLFEIYADEPSALKKF